MKRVSALFFVLLLMISCVPFAGAEGEAYNTGLYRVNDFAGWLTEAEVDEVDDLYFEFIDLYHLDLPVCILAESPSEPLKEYGDWFYEHNEFGYGPSRDGLLLVIDPSSNGLELSAYGDAASQISEESRTALKEQVAEGIQNGDSGKTILMDYRDAVIGCLTGATGEAMDTTGLPDWYPADIATFERTHNLEAPRLVDTADIFTPEEEAAILEKIETIQTEDEKDMVVFTDVSSYGMSHGVYAADFYTFNGYGFGDDYTGTILFICMEENNRGWWTAATGACQSLYTESVINALDDNLSPYMVNGDYGDGVLDYLDRVDQFYKTGKVPEKRNFARPIVAAILVGAVVGGIALLNARKQMKTVVKAKTAEEYAVPGSFHRVMLGDFLTGVHVTKTARPKDNGGGKSGFSGNYSSHGGGSFSGGGRKF